ncbi:feruloyl esterase-like protein [Obba rivulosa]|uniref:Carboxylic ester hydrolase n=1 Tax=Obba rivulosa TaxID=1052685 RepID=A0A8E2DSF1_9APHY|nr:feruloyl esterase-like protein [Obba rivulosa]
MHGSICPLWLLLLVTILACTTPVIGSSAQCTSFTIPHLEGAALLGTTYFKVNERVNISNLYSAIDTDTLPAFCRVELVITTNATANSSALTELWLPDDWNGRFLAAGQGGLAGGVDVADLGFIAIQQGFAGVSTDTGHSSDADDGTWAGPGNDNAIIDFGWRALHLSVITGKEVVKGYYGRSATKAYYIGCSTGGRQGLKEVQMFPDDFDGVVVGSPANWMSHLMSWSVHISLNVLPTTSPRFMTPAIWSDVIHPEVLRQCDGLDGLQDGIINDPRSCSFRPETLACRPGQNTSTCLTLPQIHALHRIFADYFETNQTYIFGPYYPGGETAYPDGLVGATSFPLPQNWMRFFVLNDTEWTMDEYNASIPRICEEVNPGQADAVNPNITVFVGPSHGGKILQYVGWADQLISPGNSIHYYESVHAFMQAETGRDIDEFYRLFTVPGMNHCRAPADVFVQDGFGANAFGGAGQAASGMPPISLDAQHNILAALVEWVEHEEAPSTLTAAYYNNNNVTAGVNFTRPLCKFPASLRFVGGNSNDAASFECVT